MLNSTFRRKPSAKMVQCRIALEKNGVIRPVADRIKSGKALSAPAYKQFATLAKAGDEGAATVVELAGKLADRVEAIAAYKANQIAMDNGLMQPA